MTLFEIAKLDPRLVEHCRAIIEADDGRPAFDMRAVASLAIVFSDGDPVTTAALLTSAASIISQQAEVPRDVLLETVGEIFDKSVRAEIARDGS